jgi:hypothetical protein
LRGRAHNAGSVSRISAPDIEELVETAVCNRINEPERSRDETFAEIRRVVVTEGTISLRSDPHDQCSIEIPWTRKDARPSDANLLIPAIDTHKAQLGRTPRLVAADAAFYSAQNEAAARARGVKRACIPNRNTKSVARKREQRKRWFRNGQKWRTGCEGRISVAKRRHGLNRCRYKGSTGMKRWAGLDLINIGHVMAKQSPHQ